MGKFRPKSQNYLAPRLIRTIIISSGVYFLRFRSEMPFLSKSGQKCQNYQCELKFGT